MPETLYTRSGDVSVAYQVFGEGPLDVVVIPGWVSHVEMNWEDPGFAAGRIQSATRARDR